MLDRAVRWMPMLTPRRLRQLWYAPLLAVAMTLTMLRLLLMARLLEVPEFAVYSAGLLISSTFCMVGTLGLQSALQREWPINLVHGQKRRPVVRAAQCHALAIATAGVFCLCALLAWAAGGLRPGLVVLGILHGVAQQSFLVATTESRSAGDALGYALQQLVRGGLALGVAVSVALHQGSPLAVIAAEAVVSAAFAAYTLRGSLSRVALSWSVAFRLALHRMPKIPWRATFTMMAVALVAFAALNADRWVAARVLTPVAFAQYSFVAILLAIAQALQALVNAAVYPLLARRFASAGKSVMFNICWRASVAALLFGALASVPFIALVRQVISSWYPQYAEVVPLVPLLTLVGVLRVADFWSSHLLISGHETRMLLVNVITVVAAAGAWLVWRATPIDALLSPWDIGILAALLSGIGFVLAAAAAWGVRRS